MTRCSTNLERGDSRSGLSGKSRGPPAEVDSGDRSGGGQGGRGGGQISHFLLHQGYGDGQLLCNVFVIGGSVTNMLHKALVQAVKVGEFGGVGGGSGPAADNGEGVREGMLASWL